MQPRSIPQTQSHEGRDSEFVFAADAVGKNEVLIPSWEIRNFVAGLEAGASRSRGDRLAIVLEPS